MNEVVKKKVDHTKESPQSLEKKSKGKDLLADY